MYSIVRLIIEPDVSAFDTISTVLTAITKAIDANTKMIRPLYDNLQSTVQ